MNTVTLRWYIVWAGMLLAVAAQADTWMPPHWITVSSPSKLFIAQVIPGDGNSGNFEQAITNLEYNATVKVSARHPAGTTNLVWEGKLVNPVAPTDVYISDAGNLVTLDNWHSAGYGPIVVFYGPKGQLIRYWELKDLLTMMQRIDVMSASSMWWRSGKPRFGEGIRTNTLIVPSVVGEFVFDVTDGRLLSAPPGHPKPAKTGPENLVFGSGPGPRSQGEESVTYGQLSITPDGERLCIVTPSAGAAVFDAGTGKRLDHLGGKSAEGVFLPDGRWFVRAGDKRNPVSIRAVLSGERLMQIFGTELPRGPKMETLAATQFVNRSRTGGLVLSDDGALLAAPTTNGVVVFDLAKTELRASFEFRDTLALPIAFTPDGKALLVGCAPKNAKAELKLMRIADRTELCSITRPKSRWPGPPVGIGHYDEDGGHDEVTGSRFRICELARFSSRAEMLALVQAEPQDDRCLVEVWEIPTGSLKFQRSLNCLPTQAGFVADSLTLAVTGFVKTNVPLMFFRASTRTNPNSAQDLVLIDGRNGELIRDFHLDVGAMRGDRSILFNGWGGGGTEMGALVGCLDFAVSPDGRQLAVAAMDSFIHMIDLEKAAETTTFRGHAAGVVRVVFHPSGQRLYSLDTKGEVRAWPVADPLNRDLQEQSR